MNATDKFNQAIKEKNSVLCVGLDPVIEKMAEYLPSLEGEDIAIYTSDMWLD